ncbi:cytochrome c oxidase subunit 2 [Sphingomonas jejuensis]|uniref:Cytochrome c oxidase subunit 2 n=1 Tax=Sphingomonas jejuensis TaxID=904715 RepID=A0ABX0XNA0_9SPHN|nr:cytochrome c oxidase subunit II [Sphingomonas jejuensis]NJC34858.1 cytochrome c oxidase subunit 2 [Sphingomonas jejuensis]
MTFLKSAAAALGLILLPAAALAQQGVPAAEALQTPAPIVPGGAPAPATPGEGAPNPGAPAADATPAANPAAPPMLRPQGGIGQPTQGGFTLQPQVTPNGRRAAWMHNAVLMPIIVAISIFVLILLLWVIARYRRSANPTPSKTSHNTLIEVIWTVAPVLLLVAIAIPSLGLLAAQFKPAGSDALTIKAVGNQWYWTYQYPDNGEFELISNMLPDDEAARRGEPRLLAVDNRIVVPVGREIKMIVTSNDVIHSWAVPAFWAKMDAVPGRLNELTFTVERPGVYYGQCSELCGARHAFMPIAVEAVSPAAFEAWVRSKGGTMPGDAQPTEAANVAEAADDTTTPAEGAAQPIANEPALQNEVGTPAVATNQSATDNTGN